MAKGICLLEENKRHLLFRVVIFGLGANGSHFFRGFLQDIRTHADAHKDDHRRPSFEVDITIVDGDKVEKRNLKNQLFDDGDVDEYKVNSLADRYGEHYQIEIKRVTSYCTDLEMLRKLFPTRRYGEQVQEINILIGMVDNVRP
jgi:molybdopterin/thiamine biosynthesis adenylyltransferase